MIDSNISGFGAKRLPLAGRVAAVTGSTGGLGLAMARELGLSGRRVVVSSRSVRVDFGQK